jgi:predicted transcriptional regulator
MGFGAIACRAASIRSLCIYLLLCGLAVACLVILAGDAAAVERPTGTGPHQVGYFETDMNVTTFTDWAKVDPIAGVHANPPGTEYTIHVRIYYPAQGTGEGTVPDTSGAPYITTFFGQDWNIEGGTVTGYQGECELLASHGMVVIIEGERQPEVGADIEGLDHFRGLVYHMENLTVNSSSDLFGMVDVDSMGIVGHHRGGPNGIHAYFVTEQIKAGVMLAPYSPGIMSIYVWDILGPMMRDSKVMIQVGLRDEFNRAFSNYTYDAFTHFRETDGAVCKVDLPDADEEGPFYWDMVLMFLFYHLRDETVYETFLYGEEAKNRTRRGHFWMSYDRGDGDNWTYQQPVFVINVPNSVFMDDDVSLQVTWDTDIVLDDPTLVHEWFIGDEAEPNITSKSDPNVTLKFTEPEQIDHVSYKYNIGNFTYESDVASIVVRNVWPVADAGQNLTIDQDDEFVLDASLSNDTPSDIDTLEYNWTFEGRQYPWSTKPTQAVDTSTIRKFTAYLLVRDRHGKWKQDEVTITIVNREPKVIIGAVITEALEDVELSFRGVGNDSSSHNSSLLFRWDFKDGTRTEWAPSPDIDYAYTQEGTYDAVLWVKDPLDARGNDTVRITVENVAPEGGILWPEDGAKADVDSKVEFTGWGLDTPSDNSSLWFTWDFDDGRTATGLEVSHTFRDAGRYTITLTVEDNDGATVVVTHVLTIESAGPPVEGPILFTVTVGLLALLLVGLITVTEPGKYWLGLLGAPLYIKTQDVLDNKTRHALLGIIINNPGIHYSAIREEFELANGQAAYHLNVLERESFVRAVRDGKLKRFYSSHTKVPDSVGRSPEATREAIVELVRRRPGINQLEVMEELGLSRDGASYYLRELVKEGRLTARKKGWYTIYTVRGRK